MKFGIPWKTETFGRFTGGFLNAISAQSNRNAGGAAGMKRTFLAGMEFFPSINTVSFLKSLAYRKEGRNVETSLGSLPTVAKIP
jgi:hypothetical protein